MDFLQPAAETLLERVVYLSLALSAVCGLSLLVWTMIDAHRTFSAQRKRDGEQTAPAPAKEPPP